MLLRSRCCIVYVRNKSSMDTKQNITSKNFVSQDQKPSKWRRFFTDLFIALAILQVLGAGLFLLVMTDVAQQAKDGASGTEFVAIIVYLTIVPTVGFAALINLIGLPIYMVKRRPRAVGLVLSTLSLLISLGLFLFAVNVFY